MYDIEIKSNGRKICVPVQEGGGLGSLRKRLEQDGARLDYRNDGPLTLILAIPKE